MKECGRSAVDGGVNGGVDCFCGDLSRASMQNDRRSALEVTEIGGESEHEVGINGALEAGGEDDLGEIDGVFGAGGGGEAVEVISAVLAAALSFD